MTSESLFYFMEKKEILFEGTKRFWKTNVTLTVTIVEHKSHGTLEVVCYDSALGVEAPRFYVDDFALKLKVVGNHGVATDTKAQGPTDPSSDQVRARYIVDRLFLKKYDSSSRKLLVEMQFNFADRENEQEGQNVSDMVIPKPFGLHPVLLMRHQEMR